MQPIDPDDSPHARPQRGPDMNEPESLPDDLHEFASQLASFAPRTQSVHRDALMFAAGQASTSDPSGPATTSHPTTVRSEQAARFQLRIWKCATAAMGLISLSLGTGWLMQASAEPRIVLVERSTPDAVATSPDGPGRLSPPKPAEISIAPHDRMTEPGKIETATDMREAHLLAEAWKVRRQMIADNNGPERNLANDATASGSLIRSDRPTYSEPVPLTQSRLRQERTRETLHRWPEEQL
jgi:hypothetical protein